jgi:DNA-directed RNA polymerase subunit RPC12/RpoP
MKYDVITCPHCAVRFLRYIPDKWLWRCPACHGLIIVPKPNKRHIIE